MRFFGAIKQYYNNSSLRKKLFLVLVLISVLPTLVIQFSNYAFTTNILSTHVNSLLDASLRQSHSEVDTGMKGYHNLVSDISNNEIVLENLARINVWDTRHQLSQRALREELKRAVFVQNGILGIAVIAANGQHTYYDTITLSTVESYCFDLRGIRGQEVVQQAHRYPEEIYLEAMRYQKSGYEDRGLLYLSKSLSDYRNLSNAPIGTVILCVDAAVFANAYQQQGAEDWSFVVDFEGTVISAGDETLVGEKMFPPTVSALETGVEAYFQQVAPAGVNVSVETFSTADSGYTMVNVKRHNVLLGEIYTRTSWILLIGGAVILLALSIINYTSNNIDKAVHRIIISMHRANKGDLSVRIENNGRDEFAQISQNFNTMIGEMQGLIYREKHALDRKQKAEIKALEAQINPHFLYNTLDSINWIANEHEQFEISKMLKYLAVSLRYSISNSNAVVRVKEELEYLRKYIYVQQIRFRHSFVCLIHASEDVQLCHIHKLLMQPLIENSMEHAFPGKTGQDRLTLDITLLSEQRKVQIVVSDNGGGMDDGLMHELNHFNCEADSIKSNIGIRNVITRLNIYYGDEGSFVITKNPDHGTCITMTIPYEE